MKNTPSALPVAIALPVALLLYGCAETPIADSHYGASVSMMIVSQTHDIAAETDPDPQPAMQGDGQRLEAVMEVYRTDVSGGTRDVGQDLTIRVGQ